VRRESGSVERLQANHALTGAEIHGRFAAFAEACGFERERAGGVARDFDATQRGEHIVLVDAAEGAMQTQRVDGREVECGEFGGGFKCGAVEVVKNAGVDGGGSGERGGAADDFGRARLRGCGRVRGGAS